VDAMTSATRRTANDRTARDAVAEKGGRTESGHAMILDAMIQTTIAPVATTTADRVIAQRRLEQWCLATARAAILAACDLIEASLAAYLPDDVRITRPVVRAVGRGLDGRIVVALEPLMGPGVGLELAPVPALGPNKVCRDCHRSLARSSFWRSNASPDGLHNVCRRCARARNEKVAR
jgi:hypothetical protein